MEADLRMNGPAAAAAGAPEAAAPGPAEAATADACTSAPAASVHLSEEDQQLAAALAASFESASLAAAAPAMYNSKFVAHVTMPGEETLAPNQPFAKVWRVRNTGSAAWTPSTVLVHVAGDAFGVAAPLPVPRALPGEEVELRLEGVTPAGAGRHQGYFRLMNTEQGRFGHRIWLDLFVEPTPTVAAAPADLAPEAAASVPAAEASPTSNPSFTGLPMIAAPAVEEVVASGVPAEEVAAVLAALQAEPTLGSESVETPGVLHTSSPAPAADVRVPSAPPAAIAAPAARFAEGVMFLAGMGFLDMDRNQALLQKHDGNLQAVIAELLDA